MRSPYLSPTSPAELGVAASPGYFDIPIYATAARLTPVLPDVVPKWDAPWAEGGGLFGPSLRSRDLAEVANLQSPGAPPDMAWRDFARSQPGMGSSPRQRPNFARDVASTPAFLLPSSPLARDSGFPSPSLPFVAPGALVASKRNLAARRTQKKIIPRRRLVDSQASWLLLYFAFNLGLTLYNKGVLVRFPYPYTLTAVHALFGTVGGYLLRHRNAYTPAHLSLKSYAVLAAYSVLFAVNIAVSNLSLQLVTIPVSILCHARYVSLLNALSSTKSYALPHLSSPLSFRHRCLGPDLPAPNLSPWCR